MTWNDVKHLGALYYGKNKTAGRSTQQAARRAFRARRLALIKRRYRRWLRRHASADYLASQVSDGVMDGDAVDPFQG